MHPLFTAAIFGSLVGATIGSSLGPGLALHAWAFRRSDPGRWRRMADHRYFYRSALTCVAATVTLFLFFPGKALLLLPMLVATSAGLLFFNTRASMGKKRSLPE